MTLAYTLDFTPPTNHVSATRAATAARLRPTMLVGPPTLIGKATVEARSTSSMWFTRKADWTSREPRHAGGNRHRAGDSVSLTHGRNAVLLLERGKSADRRSDRNP
jgi:hypothetical protein